MSDNKILVVDDEPHLVRSLVFVLEKAGYQVFAAYNGEEALAKAREIKPDIIFLDVMMPKKNGYEVCAELKADAMTKSSYIIILTAKGQESDRDQGVKAGADEFVTKPFSPILMVNRVKEILAGNQISP
ncbi:MAG: response regulator [Dehalococcoidales bacterium]|nr:response regulator [Dehalococcoidales bacterium]